MKTKDEVLERFLSPDSQDFFNCQRSILINFLSFEMAKTYLDPGYIQAFEEGTLPEDEMWEEDVDPKEKLMEFLPEMYKVLYKGDEMHLTQGLYVIKTLIWMLDDKFSETMEEYFDEDMADQADFILTETSKHFGYKPHVEDIEFEEIPNDN
jgi:hypothetical protein